MKVRRLHYHGNREALERFVDLLLTGNDGSAVLTAYRHWMILALLAFGMALSRANDSYTPLAFNRVRYLPMTGHERDVLGGKILASNDSPTDGFVELGEIKDVPGLNNWGELTFSNNTPYRWIKYRAAPGSHGRIGRIELYAGDQKLKPKEVFAGDDTSGWMGVFSDKPDAHHDSHEPDNRYVVLDLADLATGPPPILAPGQVESKISLPVTVRSKTAGAVIRYTLDGTIPTLENSQIYSRPIFMDKTTAINASAFVEGLAPTRPALAVYIIGEPVYKNTLHIGNSLTGITGSFDLQARTAGAVHHSDRYLIGGGWTKTLWHAAMDPIGNPNDTRRWMELYGLNYPTREIEWGKNDWAKLWPNVGADYTDLTLQPRDFDVVEEAEFDNRFISLIQQRAPNIQPWLYIEWVERQRQRPTDLGQEPTSEMKTVYPALTWEESMSAMILYGEDLKRKLTEIYHGAKPIRVIPVALAMGWIHHMIEEGQVPGFSRDDFYPRLFKDDVHASPEGAYLVDCMFYAAFYGESPEGKFLPVATKLTAAQAGVIQRLAWDAFKNYPAAGLYEIGKTSVDRPRFSSSAAPTADVTRVTLTSTTPGAWFRYTLDGTNPTRTNGYVYCGVISARPGMTLRAIAYKSGMADSSIAEATYSGVGKY